MRPRDCTGELQESSKQISAVLGREPNGLSDNGHCFSVHPLSDKLMNFLVSHSQGQMN